jgi:ribonucleotide monophosphatase NagD (HAD superfamily)
MQVTVDGPSLITMPGTLAKQYSQLGGRVQLMGKPDPLIYTAAQELVAQGGTGGSQQQQQQQWLAIGDSLEHDVAG